MNVLQAIRTCFSKYIDFKGRASRSEFWYFWIFYIVTAAIPSRILLASPFPDLSLVFFLFMIILLPPFIAVGARRLHDRNMSGWWQLISLIPLAGIVLLIFWAGRGDAIANKYGRNPLEDDVADTFS